MWDEVEKRGKRYLELQGLIESPGGPAQPQYSAWLREYGRLSRLGRLYQDWLAARKNAAEAEELLKDPATDPELSALAREEAQAARAGMEPLSAALLELVLGEDQDAGRNVILELHAGVGGDESALFVGDLYEMYRRFVERKGWKLSVLDCSPGRVGGFGEISFRVEGEGAFEVLRFEGGGHRVQRVPKTEAQGRIHTSMARVAVLPEAEEVDVQVDPKDVKETFVAAGGPGGQNVNKVATQCQLLHLPTGLAVRCMETRSQAQNKLRAWQILRSKLYAIKKAETEKARGDRRMGQLGSGDRSERIRTYNFPQDRCTDHRLEGEHKNWPLQQILGGDLEELLAQLKKARLRGAATAAES
jgi:peptide chain release factor 1